MTPSVFAIIPARAGSKGVPDKNIRPLAGVPLLVYSVQAALASETIDRVFVSTDSPAYAALAISEGAEAPFLRPPEFSGDGATDLDVMRHFLDWLARSAEPLPDLLVHLRPTTPLREVGLIDRAVELIAARPEATALRSVHEMAETAYKCMERDGEYLITAFSRDPALDAANRPRQSLPATFVANGYVDVLRTATILERAQIHGDHVLGFVTPPVTEIDRQDDFDYLEFELSRSARSNIADRAESNV